MVELYIEKEKKCIMILIFIPIIRATIDGSIVRQLNSSTLFRNIEGKKMKTTFNGFSVHLKENKSNLEIAIKGTPPPHLLILHVFIFTFFTI